MQRKENIIGVQEDSVFLRIFGNNPVLKVLDFLIVFHRYDYPLTDIARNSGVAYSSLQLLWPNLVESGLVVKTRRVGKSDLYKLNTENPTVEKLRDLHWTTVKNHPIKEKKQKIKI